MDTTAIRTRVMAGIAAVLLAAGLGIVAAVANAGSAGADERVGGQGGGAHSGAAFIAE
ncbi:hypothetical protein ACFQRL_06075 [Microbacterium fluvii]|uniref:Uncharacterized protein n=1 Tax=Microbacterium fluvii TaxID=415215 RepID=A0ABW2HDF7_9MICO|nr:hypothetical protein [Microbacterium fluvii]MCU4672153.1 hypothetical protein [Microbacterium fluvii]